MAEQTGPQPDRWRRRRVGGVLIAFGVAVWGVFGIVWLTGGQPVASHYLPFHLAGVLPGAVLNRWPSRRAVSG